MERDTHTNLHAHISYSYPSLLMHVTHTSYSYPSLLVHVHTHIYTHTHSQVHEHMDTHTHTQSCSSLLMLKDRPAVTSPLTRTHIPSPILTPDLYTCRCWGLCLGTCDSSPSQTPPLSQVLGAQVSAHTNTHTFFPTMYVCDVHVEGIPQVG